MKHSGTGSSNQGRVEMNSLRINVTLMCAQPRPPSLNRVPILSSTRGKEALMSRKKLTQTMWTLPFTAHCQPGGKQGAVPYRHPVQPAPPAPHPPLNPTWPSTAAYLEHEPNHSRPWAGLAPDWAKLKGRDSSHNSRRQ